MTVARVTRPQFPKGYVDNPTSYLTWEQVERQLIQAKNIWLCTVRPNQHPHSIPKWAVWVEGSLYFDGSPQTRHAQNITLNPNVSLHLESGDSAVILEGHARELIPTPGMAEKIAQAYTLKYSAFGYSPEPHTWDNGGLFQVVPSTVVAWTSFPVDPTKFIFEPTRAVKD